MLYFHRRQNVVKKEKTARLRTKFMNKSYLVLCMHQDLENGKGLSLKDWCSQNQMTVSSFRRYVALLRDFYWHEKQTFIIYDAKRQRYILSK